MSEAKSNDTKNWIILIISLFFMFVFGRIIPPWGPVTPAGVQVIGIFIGALLLMVSGEGMLFPGLLSLVALVVSDYSTTNNLVNSLLGNSTALMMIAVLPVAYCLTSSGTGLVLAKKLMTSRIARSSPILFTGCILLGFFLSGQFLSPTAGLMMGFPLLDSITDVMGYKRDDEYPRFLILGAYITIVVANAVLPHKIIIVSIVAAFNAGMEAVTGYTWSYGTHVLVALIALLIILVVYPLGMKLLFRVDFSKFKNFDPTKVEGMSKEDCTFTKIQKVCLSAFGVGILYPLLSMFLPADWAFTKFWNDISLPIWFFIILIVLTLVRVDGKKIIELESAFKNGVIWNLVIGVTAISLIGGGLSNSDVGIQAWLVEILGPAFGEMSWPMFVLMAIFVSTLLTNFISDTVAGVVIATFMAVFAGNFIAQGINVGVMTAAISIGASTAYLTGAAYVAAPLLLGRESMPAKWMWTKGLYPFFLYMIITTVVTIVSGYIF